MDKIGSIPYIEVKFDKGGQPQNTPEIPSGTTDLIVVSHGWNNDQAAAEDLYTKLFTNFAKVTAGDPVMAQRRLAIIGVVWPSKKLDELVTQLKGTGKAPGGAESLSAGDRAEAEAAMRQAIDRAAPIFDDPQDSDRIAALKDLVPRLQDDEHAQATFVNIVRELIDPQKKNQDQNHPEDGSDIFFEGQPTIVFKNVMQSVPASASAPPDPKELPPRKTGAAQGLEEVFSKGVNAVVNLMNLSAYYEMKQRAGTVGKNGVAPLIDELANQVDRIHLVGHSFGGRVVTAAAANSATRKLHSMSLLQAAFSHNGFSKRRNGFFRSVINSRRVAGPTLVTNTKKDLSVGLAYPAASRLSGDAAAAFGDADDPFGGIGSNGAQQMEAGEVSASTDRLQEVRSVYQWEAGRIHNLKDDRFIVDPNGGDAQVSFTCQKSPGLSAVQ
jgi:hypothetical protein